MTAYSLLKFLLSIVFIILTAIFLGSASYASTLHVPTEYSTIQVAIDASANGDTVLVADGTYKGAGNKDIDFKAKMITVKSENGADNCIIDCENSGRGFYFHNGETQNSIVSDLTIKNGLADDGGAGISCEFISSPTISNVIINYSSNNSASYGIYCSYYSSPYISGCTINGNLSFGVYCTNASPSITNCIISGSYTGIFCSNASPSITICNITGNSNGIRIYSSSPTITNCTISHNIATDQGGGISCDMSSPIITNCTIAENSTPYYGGGIFCCESSSPNITNCNIAKNSAKAGGGIYFEENSTPNITNSTITENSASVEGGGAGLVHGGGGICINNSSVNITDCAINQNLANGYGGGIYCGNDSSLSMTGGTIKQNTAHSGGGIFCVNSPSSNITNIIISYNSAYAEGGGVLCNTLAIRNAIINNNSAYNGAGIHGYSSLTNCTIVQNSARGSEGGIYGSNVFNCIIWMNPPNDINPGQAVTYSNILGGYPGEGNINSNPLFVNSAGGDFHLTKNSQCIDAGKLEGAPDNDIDGDSRPQYAGVDMGADEYSLTPVSNTKISGSVSTSIAGHDPLSIANAVITLTGAATYTIPTNETGEYFLRNMDIGTYILTINAPHFKSVSQEIELVQGQSILLNFDLEIGQYSEEELNHAVRSERLKWDVNDDNKKGLPEAIDALQTTSGIR